MRDFCGKATEPPNLPVFLPLLYGLDYRVCRILDVFTGVRTKLATLFPSGQEFCCFISEYQYLPEIQCAKDKTNSLPHASTISLLNQSNHEMSQQGVMDSYLYIFHSELVP